MPQVPHLLFCAKLSQKLHHLDKKTANLTVQWHHRVNLVTLR